MSLDYALQLYIILNDPTSTVTIDLPTGFSWFKLNADQRGFFRVNYLPQHWEAIAKALNGSATSLDASDRWGVVDDSFSLAAAGSLPYSTALNLVQVYITKITASGRRAFKNLLTLPSKFRVDEKSLFFTEHGPSISPTHPKRKEFN